MDEPPVLPHAPLRAAIRSCRRQQEPALIQVKYFEIDLIIRDRTGGTGALKTAGIARNQTAAAPRVAPGRICTTPRCGIGACDRGTGQKRHRGALQALGQQIHGSWLMAHGSWLMAHGSWL